MSTHGRVIYGPPLRSEKGKAKCNHTDDDNPPNQDKGASTCDEDVVEHDAHKSEEAPAHQRS